MEGAMGRKVGVGAAVAAAVLSWSASSAVAAGQQLCIGSAGNTVTTPVSANTCPSGRTLIALATQSEVSALQSQVASLQQKLARVSYKASGLNGKPTLTVSGANLQVDSGSGSTSGTPNGLGNVIIGYDEQNGNGLPQTGSNNLVLGTQQSFTSFAGIIGGQFNTLSGPFETALGTVNTASGNYTTVLGGDGNSASGQATSVSGGANNIAGGSESVVSGGAGNSAGGDFSSVSGGCANAAGSSTARDSSTCGPGSAFDWIGGGVGNYTNALAGSISGGRGNNDTGDYSSVLGGGFITGTTPHSCTSVKYGFFPACT
jgi:hypothetical protein